MALSTKTLDALNDSRKTEPQKYIWGQFTPDKEGVGYSDLPEQTDIPDDAKLVLDVNGPSLVKASVTNIRGSLNGRIATTEKAGIIKVGDTLTITEDGTLNALAVSTMFPVTEDFNTITGSLYSFINSTKDKTKNAPQNISASWIVVTVKAGANIFQQAFRFDNPSYNFVRSRIDGVWKTWGATYAIYHP